MYKAVTDGHEKAPFIEHTVTRAVALMPDAQSAEDGATLLNAGQVPSYVWTML